jgi:hypothetical protein
VAQIRQAAPMPVPGTLLFDRLLAWPVWPILGTMPCLPGHVAAARRTISG